MAFNVCLLKASQGLDQSDNLMSPAQLTGLWKLVFYTMIEKKVVQQKNISIKYLWKYSGSFPVSVLRGVVSEIQRVPAVCCQLGDVEHFRLYCTYAGENISGIST